MIKKTFLTILFILSLILHSCEKKESIYSPKNHLKGLSKIENQTFDLDTIHTKTITGKYGTKIHFRRELFAVAKNEIITLTLKEFYSFDQLLLNSISTITSDNKLLESSGVIKINFYAGGKEINLKSQNYLQVEFPDERMKNNNIYIGEIDSLTGFAWSLQQLKDTLIIVNKGTTRERIILEQWIDKDSVKIYLDNLSELEKQRRKNWEKKSSFENSVYLTQLNWINIDRLVNEEYSLSFNLKNKKVEIEDYTYYILYENLNSILTIYKKPSEILNFEEIKIKGNTSLFILGHIDGNFFSQKILLNELKNNSTIKLNLKKTEKEEIIKVLKQS